MNDEYEKRYKELISSNIALTEHFCKRYKERVSKSSKNNIGYVKNAFLLGADIDSIKDKRKRIILRERTRYGLTCKVYRGFVWWFALNVAITVYPISNIK